MASQLKKEIYALDWKMLIPTAVILIIAWSYAPFAYMVGVSGSHFNSQMGWLFLYMFCIAVSFPILMYEHWQARLTWPPLIASMVFAVVGFYDRFVLMLLLLLLPLFLLIAQLKPVEFDSLVGLLTFGVLLTLTICVACAYNGLHYITWNIISFLLPVMASCWYFMAPFFLANQPYYQLRATILGLVMLVAALTRPLRWQLYLALAIIVLVWFVIMTNRKKMPSFILFSLAQMVVTVLIYWS